MNTNKTNNQENLVQVIPPASLKEDGAKKLRTKKRARHKAEGHIEHFKVHGSTFYRYRRGTDMPVYLGTAENIRDKMKNPEVQR
jgi:hypothetical protein